MVLVTKTARKTAHAKKRPAGQPRRKQDSRYLKTYWPYLPMIAIVGLGIACSSLWGVVQTKVLGYATDMTHQGLLHYTNNERTASGLGGLVLDVTLSQAAQAKADDMAARDYWSHNTPEGNPPWIFFTAAGYDYMTAGENLAYGFVDSGSAVVAWMNSPGHKANILNSTYKEVGFGIANAANYQGTGPETIVVAMYGSKVAGAAASSPPSPVVPQTPPPAPVAPEPVANAPPPAIPANPSAGETQEQNAVPAATTPTATPPAVGQRNVSRIQLLSGGSAPWSMFAVTALATISIAIFFFRHGLLWHRVLVRGESFIHKHPLFDIALVALATVGYVITRSDGIIR